MADILLLVLDFDGVCTRAAAEFDMSLPCPPLRETIRTEAERIVADANARDLTTAILSNEIDPAWAIDIPLLRAVDHIVACADNKIFKPDRRAFLRCAWLAKCEPEQVLVVDDGEDNITVAASLGMHTVLFDPADPVASWERVQVLLRPS